MPEISYRLFPPSHDQSALNATPVPVGEEIDLRFNQLIIPAIKLKAPIVEGPNQNAALAKGAWRLPQSFTPEDPGNTVISGHRFRYLPPNNLTFYHLNKLRPADTIWIVWNHHLYQYQVKYTKIVTAEDLSILKPTTDSTLTLFTCHPLFSTKERLVVVSRLVDETK